MLNYTLIPSHMREGVRLYIEMGIMPGSFLTAVLENNLKEAVGRADSINKARITDWASFMFNEMPAGAQGNPENVRKYAEQQSDPATRNHFFAIFNEDGSTKPAGELKDTWHYVGQPEMVLCSAHPYDLHPKTSECKHIIENETWELLGSEVNDER
jgi:hypothetical protein